MKTLTFVLFTACMLALASQASAQVPYDSLYGVNRQGYIYIREDVVDAVDNTMAQTILIGGSVTGWAMKEAKLYGDPLYPNNPGYYLLKVGGKFKSKLGKSYKIYIQVSKDVWLPGAAESLDIFRDEDVIPNKTGDGSDLMVTVSDYMYFNTGQ